MGKPNFLLQARICEPHRLLGRERGLLRPLKQKQCNINTTLNQSFTNRHQQRPQSLELVQLSIKLSNAFSAFDSLIDKNVLSYYFPFCPYPCNICVGVLCPIQTWEWERVPEQTTSYFGHNKISNNLTARHHRHNHVQNCLIIFGKSFLHTDNDNGLVNFA